MTVYHVRFSPIDPQHIISISDGKIWQWDVNGHQIPPTYDGTHIAFSPDHTQFALCNGKVVTVQNSDSRAIVVEFHMTSGDAKHCCFSPDGRLVAAAAGKTAYVWDITSPDPHPIETFVGHTNDITSLVFSSPSSLISASDDNSLKFWKISTLSADPVTADQQSTPLTSPSIQSVSLQARAGIAISSDEDGVVKTWDLSTGLCKATFQIPDAKIYMLGEGDAKLIDGRLVFVWYKEEENSHLGYWERGTPPNTGYIGFIMVWGCQDIRGWVQSFCLLDKTIQAWSMWSWEPVGEVELKLEGTLSLDPLCVDDSRVWICSKAHQPRRGGTLGLQALPLFHLTHPQEDHS
jgi:WD40 repeat protein